jgi:hypothetical protein
VSPVKYELEFYIPEDGILLRFMSISIYSGESENCVHVRHTESRGPLHVGQNPIVPDYKCGFARFSGSVCTLAKIQEKNTC